MLKHLGLDGWQAWDYAVARLYKRTETAEGVSNMCDVCGSPNGKDHGATCPIAIAEALMVRELRKCQAGHRKPVVYVAGRFRSADGWKINENVFAAEKAGREVAALGAMPLVPHSIGAHMAGTEDDTFWLTGTLELMRRCDLVLVLPGYQESQGAMGEIAEAQRIGMPVIMPLDGAPGWEELRSWLTKPKATVTFKGKEVPMLSFVHRFDIASKTRAEVTLDEKEAPNSYDTHSWWQLRNAAQRQSVGRLELAVEDACLFDGQVLTVERENGKSEVALHTVDESGECYIWLKDDSAICKLISALSLLAHGEGPVALMAEIAEKWQTKRLIDARDKADQTLAELGIELGQREGETLLAAARRVRETGTHAEVERLTQLLEVAKQDAEDTRVRTSARIEKLCQQSNAVAKALGDHHGKTDEEAALALVSDLQEARDRHDKVAAVAEKLHKQVEDQTRELDQLMAKWEQTKGQLASERTEHKEQYLFLRSLVNAGPDEALDVAIGKAMVRIKELTSERDSLRAEVTMLRSELATKKAERIEDKQQIAVTFLPEDIRKLIANYSTIAKQKTQQQDEIVAALGCDRMRIVEAVKALIADRDTYRGQLDSMAASMAKLRAEAGGLVVERDRLKAQLDNQEKTLRDVQRLYDAAAQLSDGQLPSVQIVKLRNEVNGLRAKLADAMERSVMGHHVYMVPIIDQSSASEPAPSSEASHITQAGEAEVKKALTRPADSSCTCHLDAPCSHCTWYSDRGLDDPNEVGVGLVMQD